MANAAAEAAAVAGFPTGNNGALTFGTAGAGGTIYVRIRKLAFNWEVIATESHARTARAMYPHQRAPAQFAITLELKGYPEYAALMSFLKLYLNTYINAPKQSVLVFFPVRSFIVWGIPVSGIADGDHVGSNVFSPTIVFQADHDTSDPTLLTPGSADISRATLNGVQGDQANFFYPFSAASENASLQPETVYDFSNPNGGTSIVDYAASVRNWANSVGITPDAPKINQ
jgi:hypothetical protein